MAVVRLWRQRNSLKRLINFSISISDKPLQDIKNNIDSENTEDLIVHCIYVTGFGKTRLIAGVRNSSYSPFSPAK